MTTQGDERRELRGPNMVDDRSTLVLSGDPGPIAPLIRARAQAPELAGLWTQLARIGIAANTVPEVLTGAEALGRSDAPLVELALHFALALLHRYEADPPRARVLAAEASGLTVAICCEEHELATRAWALGCDALLCLLASQRGFADRELDAFRERHRGFVAHAHRHALAPDTLALLRELRSRGLPTERLVEGFDAVQVGLGARRRRFQGARLELTSARALRLANAPRAFRLTLERASLPVAIEVGRGAAGEAYADPVGARPPESGPRTDAAPPPEVLRDDPAEEAQGCVVWVVGGRACAAFRVHPAEASDADGSVPAAALRLAERCASVLDLDPAAVQIRIGGDHPPQPPPAESPYGGLAVVAVHKAGQLPPVSAPIARRRVISELATRLTLGIGDGRIPSAWMTPGSDCEELCRVLEAILSGAGHTVGVQTSRSTRVAGRHVERGSGRAGGGWPAVLLDLRVSAAVLEIGVRDALEHGLGMDDCEVAVWRAGAPLRLDGGAGDPGGPGEPLDALVLARARAMVVLDADDPRWPTMRAKSSAPRACLVSRNAPGEAILRHLGEGGAAAWIEPADGGAIVVHDAARTVARIATPFGTGPRASYDRSGAEAALFAVAAAHGLGVGPDAIADALSASRTRATRGAPAG